MDSTSSQPQPQSQLIPPMHTPIYTLKKSVIRAWHAQDKESLVHAANNPNVAKNLRNLFPSPYTQADAEWWVNHCSTQTPLLSFAIAHPSTNTIMGGIGFILGTDVDCRSAELGYWLGEEFWGQGVMSEVVSAIIDWGFREVKIKDREGAELGLMRMHCDIYATNMGSQGVVKKAGMLYEGRLRNSVWKDGKVMDQVIYAITRPDWEEMKERR